MIGRTTNIQNFIEEMKKLNIEVVKVYTITENMLKSFFSKNKEDIEEILIVFKQGKNQNI